MLISQRSMITLLMNVIASTLQRMKSIICSVKSDNKKTINDLNTKVNLLKAQLEEQDQLHPPHKLPRYSQQPPPPTPCPDSPIMKVIETPSMTSAPHATPLIKRIAGLPAITLQSIEHLASLYLALCMEDNFIIHHGAPSMPTLSWFVATPFYDSVGFYFMHPVLSYSNNSYSCTHIAADGGIDYQANTFFIYTFRALTTDGPTWTTSLVHCKVLDDDFHMPAITNGIILPLTNIIVGGRNSVLITKNDLNTEKKVNVLFINNNNVIRYIWCIQHTPPKLHGEFYQCALDH